MNARNDLELYERNAQGWWVDGHRHFRSLRSVSDFHQGLMAEHWGADLQHAQVADLGCGGGYLAMALGTRGARVTGIDRSPASLAAARGEAHRRGARHGFLCADLYRAPLASGRFDFVVLSDVVEHLEHPERAVAEAARLLRPGGRLFVSTFDRTRATGWLVVHLAEGLGLVPRGTHDARLFIRPAELEGQAARVGLQFEHLVWERPALLESLRTWTIHLRSAHSGLGYSAFFRKGRA